MEDARPGTGDTGLTFFFIDEAATVEALVARIIPGDASDPGAREAGALTYIDRALSGPYAAHQSAYRRGLLALDVHCRGTLGRRFRDLAEPEQDAVVAALERDEVPGFGVGGARDFFVMLWSHTLEGTFSDPAYGGNRDGAGWRLIGFPGAQYGYTADEMAYGVDLSAKPLTTLDGIRRLAAARPDLFYRRPAPEPAPPVGEITTSEGA